MSLIQLSQNNKIYEMISFEYYACENIEIPFNNNKYGFAFSINQC